MLEIAIPTERVPMENSGFGRGASPSGETAGLGRNDRQRQRSALPIELIHHGE